jgi:hypothetical protein
VSEGRKGRVMGMAPRGGMSGPWRAHEQVHEMPGAKCGEGWGAMGSGEEE